MFRFKQFSIEDNRSSMKVGTDAVLLGAWCLLPETGNVLDVGCGSGVISLMMAQRAPMVQVTGIDVHGPSVVQARENAEHSPFGNAQFIEDDFLKHSFPTFFDCIVSNPPFHTENLLPPDATRAAARSTAFLSFQDLVHRAEELLRDEGLLQVILPSAATSQFHAECTRQRLALIRLTHVRTTEKKEPKRVLMAFKKGKAEGVERNEIILQDEAGIRTESYSSLCKEYYL